MLMLTVVALSIWDYLPWRWTKKNYPPGPSGLPFFGNAFQIEKGRLQKTITEWSDKYGDVMKIKLFGNEIVVLSGYDTIREGLVTKGDDFAGRPPSYRNSVLCSFYDNVAFSTFSGKWVFMKKTTMQALKMYGENLENLEVITLDVIKDMNEELRHDTTENRAVDVKPYFERCVTGIVTSVMYGQKLSKGDIASLLDASIESILNSATPNLLLDMFPASRYLLKGTYTKLLETAETSENWFKGQIDNRRTKYQPGNPQCFVDALFDIQRKCKENNEEFQLSDGNIYGIGTDFIIAGTTVTVQCLQCLTAILVNKPELQQKMADNIAEVIGDQEPHLTDRAHLPYIDAVILELLRYISIVPLNVVHYTTVDTTINGYDIPKNTQVFYNLWKLHHNPKYWDEPWEFRPERFLDDDGNLVRADHINRRRLLQFSAGRRACTGQALAKNRLFLIVTSLIQQFSFLPAASDQKLNYDPRTFTCNFVIIPEDVLVKLVPRK